MINSIAKYICLIIFLFPLVISAQEIMTLEKAISLGLDNNFGIKIADANIRVAENNNTWARAGKGPTVDLNGTFNNNLINDNNDASFLKGTYFTTALGASLDGNWVLYSGGRIEVVKDQLNLAVSQEQLLRSQAVHDMMRQVTQLYATVLFQQEREKFLFEVFDLSKGRLAYENVRKEFGQSNSYNILQFENAVTNDSINLINQQNQIEVAKRNLYQALNLLGNQNYAFDETLSTTKEEMDVEKLKQTLDEENYTLKTLGVIAQLDQLNIALESAGRKPILAAFGSLGITENGFKFFGDFPQTGAPLEFRLANRINVNAGLSFNWNLYDGNLTKQNIESAKLQSQVTQLNVLQAKAQLYNQLDILLTNYTHQLSLLDLTEVQINNARRNIEISEERFKAGQITSLDYRAAQNQFLNAANGRVNAIYNLLISKSEIDWLVGKFNE